MKFDSLRRIFDADGTYRQMMADVKDVRESGLFDPEVFRPLDASSAMKGLPLEAVYLKNPDNWRSPVSALFDGGYYLRCNPDLAEAGVNPLLHFIRYGFFEGRRPTPLVDLDYIADQLGASSASEVGQPDAVARSEFLRSFPGLRQMLSETDVDPNPFFCNRDYRAHGYDLDNALPIEDYFRRDGYDENGVPLECSGRARLAYYISKHHDLREANVLPLRHLLEFGINEGRVISDTGTVDKRFLKATALLLGDAKLEQLSVFLGSSRTKHRLAGPTWPTAFTDQQLPSLSHRSSARYHVTIGVVLYENSDFELRRFLQATRFAQKESVHDLRVLFFSNDPRNNERYRSLIGEHELIESQENLGFGKAQNVLMARAYEQDGHCLYVGANPDGYFAPGSIDSLVNMNDYLQNEALIEAPSLPVDHPKWYDPITLDTNWVSGACFALPRPLWEATRGFDEDIHLYGEDVDLSWRVKALGGALKVCPTAKFVHDVTGRQYESEDPRDATRRRISMLKGNYHLARKWGGVEAARGYLKELSGLLSKQELDSISQPVSEMPVTMTKGIADFSQPRFAFSRFW